MPTRFSRESAGKGKRKEAGHYSGLI
jgi:hypothetical protein